MKTAILIVSYNAISYLEKCLTNLIWVKDDPSYELFLVDNSPSQDIAKLIKKKFHWVHFKKNHKNTGFSQGQNLAYRMTQSYNPDFLLALNPDVNISKNDICQLLNELKKQPKAAIIGPKLVNKTGKPELSLHTKPSILHLVLKLFLIDINYLYNHYKYTKNYNQKVFSLTGACMLIRTKIIQEIGFFDPDYFFYYEDLDLCTRIHDKKYNIIFTPKVEVTHFRGKSRSSIQNTKHWSKQQTYKSRELYFLKHKSKFERHLLQVLHRSKRRIDSLY